MKLYDLTNFYLDLAQRANTSEERDLIFDSITYVVYALNNLKKLELLSKPLKIDNKDLEEAVNDLLNIKFKILFD